MGKSICFVLPCYGRKPAGGYKMVYEYCNRLAEKGYETNILFLNIGVLTQYHLPEPLRISLANVLTNVEPRWFDLNRKIKKISGLTNFDTKLRNVDVLIATSIETVNFVNQYDTNAKKFYYVQGYENWNYDSTFVKKTYSYPMTKIVISNWLKDIVESYSKDPVLLLQNPIDISKYKLKCAINNRKKHTIGLLFHKSEVKGLKYSFAALEKLRKKYLDLHVEMFGIYKPEFKLPDWISFTYKASQDQTIEIYNSIEVFMCSSLEDGFGLTGLEAMACGAALASTSYKGVYEYAQNGVNSLLSPIRDVDAMVDNVSRLFEDDQYRYILVSRGVSTAQKFSWDRAMKQLINIID